MQEFFEQGTLPVHDLVMGLREAVIAKRLFPVMLSLCAAQYRQRRDPQSHGRDFPFPAVRAKTECHATPDHQGEIVDRKIADSEPLAIFVFKTVADPFAGRINYFKVISGVLKNDATSPISIAAQPNASSTSRPCREKPATKSPNSTPETLAASPN